MPRAKATPGVPGYGPAQQVGQAGGSQAPAAPTGMPYGEHQASIDAQTAMPLPEVDPSMIHQAGQQAAMGVAPPAGGFTDPSARPGEHVLAGVQPLAPPPVAPPPPAAQFFQTLAAAFGDDPDLADLAAKARALRA